MKKRLSVVLTAVVFCVCFLCASYMVYARNVDSYSATVPKISDYETPALEKTNTTSGVNNVSSMGSGTLVSWIESTGGSNITSKKTYSGTGRYLLDYSSASSYVDQDVKLNISTALSQWSSVATSGSWSPDEN